MNRVRVCFLMGRRELSRHRTATVLIVLLIAIPVFVASLAVTHDARSDRLRQGWSNWVVHNESALETLQRERPAGVELVVIHSGIGRVSIKNWKTTIGVNVALTEAAPAVLSEEFVLRSGRLPRTSNEVMIRRSEAKRMGVAVGGLIDLSLVRVHRLTVTGLFEDPRWHREAFDLVGRLPASELAEAPRTTETLVRVNGRNPRSRPEIQGIPSWAMNPRVPNALGLKFGDVFPTYISALMFMALVTTAGFAVVVRRRKFTTDLLNLNGAPWWVVRGSLAAYATWCGLLGAFLGVSIAVAIGAAPLPGTQLWRLEADRTIPYAMLAKLCLVPPLVAALASLWPTLFGDKPRGARSDHWFPSRARRLSPTAGLVGGAATLVLTARSSRDPAPFSLTLLALIVSVALMAPAVVTGIGRVATFLPRSGRLAARSVGRSASRSGAIIAAIWLVVGGIVVGGMVQKTDSRDLPVDDNRGRIIRVMASNPAGDSVRPVDVTRVVDAARANLRITDELDLVHLRIKPRATGMLALRSPWEVLVVTDDQRAELWRVLELPTSAQARIDAAFERGSAVEMAYDIEREMSSQPLASSDDSESLSLEYVSVPWSSAAFGPMTVVSKEVFDQWAGASQYQRLPDLYLATLRVPISETQWQNLYRLGQQNGAVVASSPYQEPPNNLLILASLSGAATVVSLILCLVFVSLQVVETRQDRHIFSIVGASPTVGANVLALSAWFVAGAGSALGVVSGTVYALLFQRNRRSAQRDAILSASIEVPWSLLGVLALAGPALIAIIVWIVMVLPTRRMTLLRRPDQFVTS